MKHPLLCLRAAVAVCAASAALPSHAQFDGATMASYGAAMTQVGLNAVNTYMLLGAMQSPSQASAEALPPKTGTVRTQVSIDPALTQRTLDKLAAVYPSAQRSTVHTTLRQMLEGYKQLEQKLGMPRNDLASAVATFIAGSYGAYRDVDLPDEQMRPLVEQIHQAIATNPRLAKASNAEKQEMYEQMAVLGVFIATTRLALQEHPNAQTSAQMRQAAKGYLEQFLKTDADRIAITERGLVIR